MCFSQGWGHLDHVKGSLLGYLFAKYRLSNVYAYAYALSPLRRTRTDEKAVSCIPTR